MPKQTPPNDMLSRVIHFLDRNSRKVLDKGSNPYSQWVTMQDTISGLKIWFHLSQSPYGNGGSEAKVWVNKKLVFHASGNGFMHQQKVTKFIGGTWVKKL